MKMSELIDGREPTEESTIRLGKALEATRPLNYRGSTWTGKRVDAAGLNWRWGEDFPAIDGYPDASGVEVPAED